jgi:uncharacterized protein YjbI with pentapeptide repeats
LHFHDKDHYTQYEQKATERFENKVKDSISDNKPLECVGYYLPAINFATLLEGKSFAQSVYFSGSTFSEQSYFSEAKFLAEAHFLDNQFKGKTLFRYTLFEQPNKVTFDGSDLSKVSFADCDITRIRFGDNITWG